jgi:hypothetical protein
VSETSQKAEYAELDVEPQHRTCHRTRTRLSVTQESGTEGLPQEGQQVLIVKCCQEKNSGDTEKYDKT